MGEEHPLSINWAPPSRPLPPPPPRPHQALLDSYTPEDFYQTIQFSWALSRADLHDMREYLCSYIHPLRDKAIAIVHDLIPPMLKVLRKGLEALTLDHLRTWNWRLHCALYSMSRTRGCFEGCILAFQQAVGLDDPDALPQSQKAVARMASFGVMVASGPEVACNVDTPILITVPELLFLPVKVAEQRFGSADELYIASSGCSVTRLYPPGSTASQRLSSVGINTLPQESDSAGQQ